MAPRSDTDRSRDRREREKKKESRRDDVRSSGNTIKKAAKSQRRAPPSVTESGPHSPFGDSDGHGTPSNGAYSAFKCQKQRFSSLGRANCQDRAEITHVHT